MPELPDIAGYITALESRIAGQPLTRVSISKPFVLRTPQPDPSQLEGRRVRELRRIGKRIAIGLEGDYWIVLHLMIAGRLHWAAAGTRRTRAALAAFDFPDGTLVLTEAGSKRRASLHIVVGEAALSALDPGGIDVLQCDLQTFRDALLAENRTLKRVLTDPRVLSGIGNAFSDEILHAARLSPIAMTQKLDAEQWSRLFEATQATLRLWIDRLAGDARARVPQKRHRLSRRYGGARPLWEAVPRLR